MEELVSKVKNVHVDHETGLKSVEPIPDNPVEIDDDLITRVLESTDGDLSDAIEEEAIIKAFDELGVGDDFKTYINALRDFRKGRIKRVKFNQLPEILQQTLRISVGNNVKALQDATDKFVAEQIREMYEDAKNQQFGEMNLEDKTYEELYEKQVETFEAYNNPEDEERYKIYLAYQDAVNFDTLSELCKVKLHKKRLKHPERLIKSYYHNYNKDMSYTTGLDVSKIPNVLERHAELNGDVYEYIIYEIALITFLDYIVMNNLKSSDFNNHIFMYITTKSIFDLDYLDANKEVYAKRYNDIKTKVLDVLKETYEK